ncbi:MAG TPA: TonB-dependent receptor [Rhizomicrobium sp.]|nr:TonB-dependent receptor [Rhizomicrobium sp.]
MSNLTKKTRARGVRLLSSSAIAAAIIATGQAKAADPDAAPPAGSSAPAPSASPSGDKIEMIVVTARRRAEQSQDVPEAITAFSQDDIRNMNLVSPFDLSHQVPSLSVSNSNASRNAPVYYIRGQGQALANTEGGVVSYFDEVPTLTSGPGLLFDLENIQVLKGPQGTLFGRNTTGGAVLFQPQRPQDQFGGYLDVDLGDYNLRRVEGAVNVPVVDNTLLARFSFDINSRDGFTKDLTNNVDLDDTNYGSYRFSLQYQPNDQFQNYLDVFYENSDTNGTSVILNALKPGGLALTLFPALAADLATQNALGIRKVDNTVGPEYDRYTNLGATDIITYAINDGLTIKTILGYRAYEERQAIDDDGTPAVLVGYPAALQYKAGGAGPPSQEQFSGEFQLQGNSFDDQLKWIGGLYAERRDPWPNGDTLLVQDILTTVPTFNAQRRFDNSYAVYGEGTFDASRWINGLAITAGVRFTWDKRTFTSGTTHGVQPTPAQLTTNSANFSAPTWNVNVSYKVDDGIMAYAAARRGYKTGGFNTPNAVSDTFQPEYLTDFEIGLKTEHNFDWGALRFNVDGYSDQYSNVQVNQNVATPPPAPTFVMIVTNAAGARINGLEAEADMVSGGLELSGFYSYTDSWYTRYISPISSGGVTNFTGLPLAITPKNKVGVSLSYGYPLSGDEERLVGRVNYTYQSSEQFRTTEQADPFNTAPGYGLLNLRVDWEHFLSHPLTASLFMTNATDQKYIVYRVGPYNELGYSGSLYGEPRMFGVELRYDFSEEAGDGGSLHH